MSYQCWVATLSKQGRKVRLFTRTTDEMVKVDLALPQYASLISLGTEGVLSPQDNQNQAYLAAGAIKSHLLYSNQYDGGVLVVSKVDAVPNAKPINSVGGKGTQHSVSFLCNIWEEDVGQPEC